MQNVDQVKVHYNVLLSSDSIYRYYLIIRVNAGGERGAAGSNHEIKAQIGFVRAQNDRQEIVNYVLIKVNNIGKHRYLPMNNGFEFWLLGNCCGRSRYGVMATSETPYYVPLPLGTSISKNLEQKLIILRCLEIIKMLN